MKSSLYLLPLHGSVEVADCDDLPRSQLRSRRCLGLEDVWVLVLP